MWLCMMDQEKGDRSHCRKIINWADVERAVDSLNNTTITNFTFGIATDEMNEKTTGWYRWFDVTGGNQDRVMVYFFDEEDDENFIYILTDPSQTETTTVYHGPLKETWEWKDPAAYVTKSFAKHVMKHFFEHEERLLEGITWEEA